MIGSRIEMNNSIYLKIPITIEAINRNKYEMLQYNEINGIIDFNRQHLNDACFLTYHLDTYVSLRTLINQNSLLDNLLIELLTQINEIVESLEAFFLLETKDLLLTLDNVYYDYHKRMVHLVYLPRNHEKTFHSNYKMFLIELIENTPVERRNSLLMNALNRLVYEKKITVQALNDLIKNQVLEHAGALNHGAVNVTDEIFLKSNSLADAEEDEKIKKSKSIKSEIIKEIMRGIAIEIIGLLTMNLVIIFYQVPKGLKQLGVILFLQMITFIFLYFIVIKNYYDLAHLMTGLNSKSAYKREMPHEKNIFASNASGIKATVEEEITYNTSTVIEGMVDEVYSTKAYLLKKDLISEEKIYITNKSFVIGRQVETTDYHIKNTKVSKRHLEILDIDEELFVRDLNSTNGTYLNEEKLEGNRLTKIFHGDLIEMANLVYEFRIE